MNTVKNEAESKIDNCLREQERERGAMQDQLNQRMEREKELFQEIKRYQDSVSYLSRQLDERTASLDELKALHLQVSTKLNQESSKHAALKKLHEDHTQKP